VSGKYIVEGSLHINNLSLNGVNMNVYGVLAACYRWNSLLQHAHVYQNS